MGIRILVNTGLAAVLAVAFAGCGSGSSSNSGGSPTSPGGNDGPIAATIVIDATGNVTPRDVTVPAGSRVTFTNNHNDIHQIASDPHPEHTLCQSLNTVGFVSAGQSRTSSNLNPPMVCTYHDHINDTDARLKGTIRVQ
jgi:plastocyanin